MKEKLRRFAYALLLAIHLIMVFIVPIVPWIIILAHPQTWLVILACCVFIFIQLPIMIYACTKEHSIIDKLVEKIENIKI